MCLLDVRSQELLQQILIQYYVVFGEVLDELCELFQNDP